MPPRSPGRRAALLDRAEQLYRAGVSIVEISRRLGVSDKMVRGNLVRRFGSKYRSPPAGRPTVSPGEITRRRRIARTARTWREYEARVHPRLSDRRVNPILDRYSYGIEIRGRQ